LPTPEPAEPPTDLTQDASSPGLDPGIDSGRGPFSPPGPTSEVLGNGNERVYPPPVDVRPLFNGVPVEPISTATVSTESPLGGWKFHMDKAESFIEREMYEDAIEELLICLAKRPNDVDAHLMIADAYDKVGRGEKALYHYELARVLAPNNPKPFFRTGNYYLRHGLAGESSTFYDNALNYYNLALRIDLTYSEAWHNAAIVYMKLNNFERAEWAFKQALKYNPEYAKAHRNLGLLYEMHLNKPQEARRQYQEYLRIGGPDEEAVRQWLQALPAE
jgi:tetratricopeptide (TPR) repeat protein